MDKRFGIIMIGLLLIVGCNDGDLAGKAIAVEGVKIVMTDLSSGTDSGEIIAYVANSLQGIEPVGKDETNNPNITYLYVYYTNDVSGVDLPEYEGGIINVQDNKVYVVGDQTSNLMEALRYLSANIASIKAAGTCVIINDGATPCAEPDTVTVHDVLNNIMTNSDKWVIVIDDRINAQENLQALKIAGVLGVENIYYPTENGDHSHFISLGTPCDNMASFGLSANTADCEKIAIEAFKDSNGQKLMISARGEAGIKKAVDMLLDSGNSEENLNKKRVIIS